MSAIDTLREIVNNTGGMMVMVPRHELGLLILEVDNYRAALAPRKSAKKAPVNKVAAVGEGYPTWLPLDAWNAFLEMRKKIKKPATEYAQKLLLKKLAAFYAHDLDVGVILNQSIVSGWQDLYAPKEAGRGYGYDVAPGRAGVASPADQNRANAARAKEMLFGRRPPAEALVMLEDDHAGK